MDKQIIISISREYGSAGHEIAEKVAKDLGISLYDRKLLDELAQKHGMDTKELEKYDETPKGIFLTRSVKGHTTSLSDAVANLQFDFIKDKAKSGESFVIVGRCAEIILADNDALMSFFIVSDKHHKVERVMKKFDLSKDDAVKKMSRHDKKRKEYHNTYSKYPWGDSRGYDVCINSSKLGIDGTAEVIENYVKTRIK